MKKLLILAAVSEATTGLLLFFYPPIVVRLLFGADIAGAGIILSRIAGISLIALGVGSWPRNTAHGALFGMLTLARLQRSTSLTSASLVL